VRPRSAWKNYCVKATMVHSEGDGFGSFGLSFTAELHEWQGCNVSDGGLWYSRCATPRRSADHRWATGNIARHSVGRTEGTVRV
jgi:hypothetical protein